MNKNNYPIKSAYVIGSTSEIAKEICKNLAYQGCLKFHLIARNKVINLQLADELKKINNADCHIQTLDLI